VSRLASLLARLHEQGFSHRDLKSTNVLLDAELRPYLIDLDGLRQAGRVTAKRSARDLARLWRGVSASPARLGANPWRFLKAYRSHRGWQADLRSLARQIQAETV
jgi:tRNA A-37 threonylcarbamoyl transferase component Bud32